MIAIKRAIISAILLNLPKTNFGFGDFCAND